MIEPGPDRPRAGLRRRLVGAFLLVTILPLILFSTAVAVLFEQGLERATRDRLDSSLAAVPPTTCPPSVPATTTACWTRSPGGASCPSWS